MSQLNLIGATLGRFEILSELGRGGMAVVYKARQPDLDRIVALKILPPGMTHDDSYIARFRQEARSVARLEHPHIMPIYEIGEANGLHYIAMKFIQGRTLKELMQQEGALGVRQAAEILAQVGDALDYAHRQGVIHRDIKPSNIMITAEGWAYLTDFGLARGTDASSSGLTMTGTVMGTPEYMSPEQAQGLASVGPPTDIYALGVVLYELLTGAFPFHAETPMAMLAARLIQAPIPPRDVRGDLPPAVEDVVMRSLARKPEARFASSSEMVAALRSAAGVGAAPQAQPPVTPQAGTPALGATIVVGQNVGAPRVGMPPAPTIPAPQASPAPTLPPLPATPAMPATPGAPVRAPLVGARLLIGIGAAALLLVIAVLGGLALIGRPDPNPTPGPASGQVAGLIRQGDEALAAGEIDEAIAAYRQAADQSPGNTAALSGVALAYNLSGDWAEAEDSATNLINAALSDDAAAALGLTLLADAIASQGGIIEASSEIKSALDLDSDLALVHAINANLMAIQAADRHDTAALDAALAQADAAVDSMAGETTVIQALTYNALAVTFHIDYNQTGNAASLTESESDYQQAIDLLPSVALFHSNLGYLYSDSERYDKAREAFQQALDADPSYAQAQIGIGWSYYDQDKADQAAAAFDAALKLQPDESDAYFARGRLAYDDDDYPAAIDLFEQAIQINPRNATAQAFLGESYLFNGFNTDDSGQKAEDYQRAADAYHAALAINPNNITAASGLGWILQYQDKYEESVAQFEQALTIDDSDDEIHNGLGWSLYNLDKFDEAEAAFRRAIELAPDYISAHYGLGLTLEKLGRTDEARAAFQQALDLDPSYTSAQDALDRIGP